jgi:hypothetical protein
VTERHSQVILCRPLVQNKMNAVHLPSLSAAQPKRARRPRHHANAAEPPCCPTSNTKYRSTPSRTSRGEVQLVMAPVEARSPCTCARFAVGDEPVHTAACSRSPTAKRGRERIGSLADPIIRRRQRAASHISARLRRASINVSPPARSPAVAAGRADHISLMPTIRVSAAGAPRWTTLGVGSRASCLTHGYAATREAAMAAFANSWRRE